VKGNHEPDCDLAELVQQLRDEVQLLRMAVDELREEVQRANRNVDDVPSRPLRFRLTSMPADPTASDWAKRLNEVDSIASQMPDTGETGKAVSSSLDVQQSLF